MHISHAIFRALKFGAVKDRRTCLTGCMHMHACTYVAGMQALAPGRKFSKFKIAWRGLAIVDRYRKRRVLYT
jgi:hypothetical protein